MRKEEESPAVKEWIESVKKNKVIFDKIARNYWKNKKKVASIRDS
jgi:hypothetical protein